MFMDNNEAKEKKEQFISVEECVYSINTLFGEDMVNGSMISSAKENENETINDTSKITKGDVIKILKKIGGSEDLTAKSKNKMSGNPYVTRVEWADVLTLVLQEFNMQEICKETEFCVFAVSENTQDEAGQETVSVITDAATLDYYKGNTIIQNDRLIKAFVRDSHIVFVTGYETDTIRYENVLIRETNQEKITVRLGSVCREFLVKGLTESLNNIQADITISKGAVTELTLKRDSITGKVLAISDGNLEIEGFGKVALSAKCRYYIGYKDFEEGSMQNMTVGSEHFRFLVADKEICGIILQEDTEAKNIRVLLKSSGYGSLFHDKASVSCQGRYQLSYYIKDEAGNIIENVLEHEASEIQEIVPESQMLVNGRIKITPIDGNAKTVVNSISRNGAAPEYRGTIEISNYDGKLVLINELPLEEYLYAVIPSEMPSSYGVEALKVQAVCARSYAVSHLGDTKLSKYGAQVDDSTDYQVYNNTKETENSISAVQATYGEVLKCGETIANTYFFATSCGSTADSSIWGGTPLPYIQGKLLSSDGRTLDLANNEVFTNFIKTDYETFDKGTAWYRWNLSMTYEQLTKSINGELAELYQQYPDKILTLCADGTFESREIKTIGTVKNITVLSRLTGGVIEELLIEGEQATIKVIKQSTIRNLINPNTIPIHKCDGSTVDTFQALPSAFFAVEQTGDGVTFYGGGYGHGAGMSQTAVKNMIACGMDYKEILQFFYTDVTIGYYGN